MAEAALVDAPLAAVGKGRPHRLGQLRQEGGHGPRLHLLVAHKLPTLLDRLRQAIDHLLQVLGRGGRVLVGGCRSAKRAKVLLKGALHQRHGVRLGHRQRVAAQGGRHQRGDLRGGGGVLVVVVLIIIVTFVDFRNGPTTAIEKH